ncbi:hypothetical protein [Oceaniglobus ichthyenteri]|uniref:hypothetical protein n=1 Tax=Oceaniglobus ichthyenteri TaxID=2136177 RepID=UPI000D346DE8|nr:hypothetical protein [Oceaniglobus ichthyenteri]
MDIITGLLASEQVQTAIIALIGLALTIIVNRASAAFTLATGIQIEARHREALHEAIISGVESAMRHGPNEAFGTLRAHVVQHLRESVPDALKALTPGDGVIDRLIERYAAEAFAKIGESK